MNKHYFKPNSRGEPLLRPGGKAYHCDVVPCCCFEPGFTGRIQALKAYYQGRKCVAQNCGLKIINLVKN